MERDQRFKYITREEWNRKPEDYRGRYGPMTPDLEGERNMLEMDTLTGWTVLVPVRIID